MYKRRLLFIALCAFAVALVFAFGWRVQRYGPVSGHTVAGANVPAMVRSLRPNYPYSVIAGGAYSRAELRFANDHDAVVRQHYADFDVDSARVVTLTEDRYEYASYRVKDRIYWTRRRLRMRKGEVLLTDGTHYARARCGNRLSSKPKTPTLDVPPPETALNLPPFTPEQLMTLQLAPTPPPDALEQQFPPGSAGMNPPSLLPKAAEAAIERTVAWPGFNPYFPMAFDPGVLYNTPRNSSTSPPAGTGTPPPITSTNTLPPLLPIPEPATICLALFAALACMIIAGVAIKRGRQV